MMKRHWLYGMRLSMLFSLVVMVIFLITSVIMVTIGLAAMHFGLVEKLGLRRTFPIVLAVLPASVIVGTLVSLIFGRIPLEPVRQMIDATNRLAAGDFSARLTFHRVAGFRALKNSFNRMAEELSSVELLRSDFVNNFSHEFKTPIVSIKGFAELLKEEDLTPQERNAYLDIIIQESSRLATMATNVLNLSRIENQMIVTDRKTFDLSEQIRRCVLLLQSAWEKKRLEPEIELDETTILANEEMLSQVWLNLLDNAIKFTPEGGRLAIRLANGGAQATVAFCDSGPGIAAVDAEHIFDRFYQGDTSHTTPGNGIGLTLARKIARLHGGDITCQNRADGGTEFTVRLPLADGQGEAQARPKRG